MYSIIIKEIRYQINAAFSQNYYRNMFGISEKVLVKV